MSCYITWLLCSLLQWIQKYLSCSPGFCCVWCQCLQAWNIPQQHSLQGQNLKKKRASDTDMPWPNWPTERNRKLVVDIFTINRVRVLIQFKCYTELYSRKQVQLTILSFSSLILHSGAVWVYTCSAAFFLLIVTVCFPQSATGFI